MNPLNQPQKTAGQTNDQINRNANKKGEEVMQGPVRHFSQLPHSRRLESRIKPPAQAFTQNGYELQKQRTPACAQEGAPLTHKDTGSTSCSCSRTLLKSRSQLALALAGPGSMISLFGKLQWSNSLGDSRQ